MKFLAVSTVLAAAGGLVCSSVFAADARYPASDFQPKVIYSAEGLHAPVTATETKPAEKTAPDPKYPAAYFEPKVIYSGQ